MNRLYCTWLIIYCFSLAISFYASVGGYVFQLLLLLSFTTSFVYAQTLTIHSVGDARQSNGDNGYTLDGNRMVGSRAKLLSSQNFGPTGTYGKTITIVDGYTSSGSLTEIAQVPIADNMFFFGNFNKMEASMTPFTEAELDSLYEWSLNGGKVIIGGGGGYAPVSWDASNLDETWGFELNIPVPGNFSPNALGSTTAVFDGPFGTVSSASQGGGGQGYFSVLPSSSTILATNADGDPTLIMDCKTLDLISADVDAYTSIGGITIGELITNDQDRFWANTIAFMDRLQSVPEVSSNGTMLSVDDSYVSYQWYYDGVPIGTDSVHVPLTNGYYNVEVELNGGCILSSDTINVVNVSIERQDVGLFHYIFNERGFEFSAEVSEIVVLDLTGRVVFNRRNGRFVQVNIPEGVSGLYVIKVTPVHGEQVTFKQFLW